MSTLPHQDETFRFITFRAGDQRIAIKASAVIKTLEAGVVVPDSLANLDGTAGTFRFEQEELPVFNVAEWLDIADPDRNDHHGTDSLRSLIVQAPNGRIVLLVRDVSTMLDLPAGHDLPLPAPLDRLVGDRYSAVLKWPTVEKELRHKQLSDRITTWKARRDEREDELFLLLNLDCFLQEENSISPELATDADSNLGGKTPALVPVAVSHVPSAERIPSKQRLILFSPTPDTLGDRPYLFGISATQVMEVCRPMVIIPVPGASDSVIGLVNWRGTIVPVLRMAEMVGLEGIPANQAERLLIALAPDGRNLVGVQVLASMRTQDLPVANTPHPLPLGETSRYLHGSYELENETLIMPNLKSMVQLA